MRHARMAPKLKKPYYLKSITKNLLTTLNPTDFYLTKIKH